MCYTHSFIIHFYAEAAEHTLLM